ncbi:hypothetical protein BKA70DRAFT_754858 [Coprinopsis sp. MPI-PUGE-AT-0042]|nr:hypothetical protein BKA70DRAFT_754858 [Coprinopsis sp. MPI-PUGE-AT-0042]
MASRNAPRTGRPRRLPRHLNLDYTLTPAPAHLSISTVAEKSPLPAIVVTPSSPSTEKRFSIAFLAPPKKPSARERVAEYFFPKPHLPASPSPESEPLFPSAERNGSQADECSAWRDTWRGWTSSVNAPIALPVTSPISGNAPNSWHKAPPRESIASFFRRPSTRWTIIAFLAFLLVLFHTFNHYLESSAGSLRSRDLGIAKAEVPFGSIQPVGAMAIPEENATEGQGKESGQGWKDWQGWYKLNHGRGGRTGTHHVPPQLKVANPSSIPVAVRSALARNEV